jgi:hypothetical protein
MGANQNSSSELDLCPKSDPTRISSNSVKTTEKLLVIGKATRTLESKQKHNRTRA